MKKLFLGAVAFAAVAMTSCNSSVDDTVSTFSYPQYSLVTDLDNGKTKAVESKYSVFMNHTKRVGAVATSLPFTFDDVKYSFSTDTVAIKMAVANTPEGKTQFTVINGVKGNVNNDISLPLKNFTCEVALFIYPNGSIPVIKDVPPLSSIADSPLILNYDMGDRFHVKTFLKDCFYAGPTKTTYPGEGGALQSFTNREMFYRVVLDVEKSTAKVIMYYAKFSDKMPKSLNIVLDNLPVIWTKDGYSIVAKDIVPKVAEGGGLTDNENYKFNSFSMRFTDSRLTTASIEYNVKGIFNGSFLGSCLLQFKDNTGN